MSAPGDRDSTSAGGRDGGGATATGGGPRDERAARLDDLRRRYLDELINDLGRLSATLESQCLDDPRGDFRRRLHSLRGSGGAYGFAEITDAAARAEAACRAGDGRDRVAARLDGLLACATRARAGLPDAGFATVSGPAPAPANGRPS